jgi:hypothetical protein
MAAQQQPEVVVTADAVIGFQKNKSGGGLKRSRVPADVIDAMEGQDGEYFRYTVLRYPNGGLRVIGDIVSADEARPRDLIAEKQQQAASKAPAKTARKKKGPQESGDDLMGAFGAADESDGYADEDEDDDDEPPVATLPKAGGIVARGGKGRKVSGNGPASSLPALPSTGTPTRQAQKTVAALPTIAGRQPRVQGAIAKPGIARKKGGVKYTDLPE